jgi:hypothetical protein
MSDEKRDARASLEGLVHNLSEIALKELDSVRAGLEQRIAASVAAISADPDELIKVVEQDFQRLSADSAKAAAEQARRETQEAADKQLAAARKRIDVELANGAAIRQSLEATQREFESFRASAVTKEEKLSESLAAVELEAQRAREVCEARAAAIDDLEKSKQLLEQERTRLQDENAAAAALLDQEAAARASTTNELESTHGQLQALQQKFDAFRREAASIQEKLSASLNESQSDAKQARQASDAQAAALDTAKRQIQTLEAERVRLDKQYKEATSRVEEDVNHRNAMTAALEQARANARAVMDKAEMYVRTAADRMNSQRELLEQLEEDNRKLQEERRRSGVELEVLGRIRDGMRSLDAALTVDDVWERLLKELGLLFARAAVLLVRQNSLQGWGSVGLDSSVNISAVATPLTIDSILTRALREGEPVVIDNTNPGTGLFGNSAEWAIALPVFADGYVAAIGYAEQPKSEDPGAPTFAADMLARHAGRCAAAIELRAVAPSVNAAATDAAVVAALQEERTRPVEAVGDIMRPKREARRVRIRKGTEIAVGGGGTAALVDLSIGGAQLLSAQLVRPNQNVRLVFPTDDKPLTCKGKIVWAMFELSSAGTTLYRAGVKFTECDAPSVESFMTRFADPSSAPHDQQTSSVVA